MISMSQPDVLWRDRIRRIDAINQEAWKLTDPQLRIAGSSGLRPARSISAAVRLLTSLLS